MKKWLLFLAVGALAVQADDRPSEEALGKRADEMSHRVVTLATQHRVETLACVTPKPVFMAGPAAAGCGTLSLDTSGATAVSHENRFIKVFITPAAKQDLLEGKASYTVGTVIVKEKCRDAEAKVTELFTVMIKREPGFNPTVGDWEFMVLDHEVKITDSGAIYSCMQCHQKFSQTDFLSRVYLQNRAVTK